MHNNTTTVCVLVGDYAYYKDYNKKSGSSRVYIFKDGQGRTYAVTCKDWVVTDVWDKLNSRHIK